MGTSGCDGFAGSFSRLRFFLRPTGTEKNGEYNDRKISLNGNREGVHRMGFGTLATTALLSFARGFWLTHCPFCSDLAIGVLWIKFRAGRENFYLFWQLAVVPVRWWSMVDLLLRRLVFFLRRRLAARVLVPVWGEVFILIPFWFEPSIAINLVRPSHLRRKWISVVHRDLILTVRSHLRRKWICTVHRDWSRTSDRV